MIDDDDRHPEPSRFGQRLEAGGAAIHRHQQRGALARKHTDRLGVGAVALEKPVGNMNQRIKPAMAQVPCQQRRRSGAVDIVIAEDRDFFVSPGRARDAFRRHLHLCHRVRIGHQFADGRIEKILDRVDPDIAPRQHPRQHLRQLIALRDRECARGAAGIEPVAPQFSGDGLRNAEKRRRRFDGQCGCRERHDALGR